MPIYNDISIRQFNGLWDRGQDDTVPKDHFIDILNMIWDGDDVTTRDGSVLDVAKATIDRVHEYKIQGQASRLLILSGANIYDTADLSTSILGPASSGVTFSGMTDFSMCVFYNRAYITPHNRVEGMAGQSVYVYNGSGVARLAAGVKPSGSITAALSGSGNIEKGVHYFAVVYETASGHYTVPGPDTFSEFDVTVSTGVSVVLTPPYSTAAVKRHIVSTRAIATESNTGNQGGYSYYFIPNATITGGSGSTTITVSFYDAELLDSADYLFNQLATIPACVNLVPFNGRMVTMGEDGGESFIRVSKAGQPESFDSISGYIKVGTEESDSIRTAFEFREILYVAKPNRFYAIADNGLVPGSWIPIPIDKGTGSTVYGVGTVLDTPGTHMNYSVIATKQGLSLFDGTFAPLELSHKIESLWKRINKSAFDHVQTVLDTVNKIVYVAVPLDSATKPSHILVGDYSRGMEPFRVRWSVWTFPSNMDPTSIFVRFNSSDIPVLHWGSIDGNVFRTNSGATNDNDTAIPTPRVQTFLSRLRAGNEVNHFETLTVRAKGSGYLELSAIGYDSLALQTLNNITLASSPQSATTRFIGVDAEVCSIKLAMEDINDSFTLTELSISANIKWDPAIV